MKIAMANDHAGTALKNQIKEWLEAQGHEVVDFGTYDDYSGQGHRRNMLGTNFNCVGIACYQASDGSCYWVQCFGKR